MDHFVIYVSCMSCFLVCSLQLCGHLRGEGLPLGSCHFPMWCPMSGVVIDCIDS